MKTLKTKKRGGGTRRGLGLRHVALLEVLGLHEKAVASRTRALLTKPKTLPWRQRWAIAIENRKLYKAALEGFIQNHLSGEAKHEDHQNNPGRSAPDEGSHRNRPARKT